ncbi:MAG: ribosome maturation factor RimP [Deltaproteobacteria bacterium]|nr:ribosome maturation factor RimP [Deltaproteobacteria bacterium]
MSDQTYTAPDRVQALIAPICIDLGLDLWGVECHTAPGRTGVLRIYVDEPGGVSVERCAELSRKIGLLLDVEDVMPGRYRLEVSSPGMERRFFEPGQLAGYVGETVLVRLQIPRQGAKTFRGALDAVLDDGIFRIKAEQGTETFAWNEIKSVNLVVDDPFHRERTSTSPNNDGDFADRSSAKRSEKP